MSISTYVQQLLPSIGKGRILDDIKMHREHIRDSIQGPYVAAVAFFKDRKFKSQPVKNIQMDWNKVSGGQKSENFIKTIQTTFENVQLGLNEVEKLVEEHFSQTVAPIGMTYLKANLLRHVELVGFATRYARRLLLFVYAMETAEYNQGKAVTGSFLTKPERDWLMVNFANFVHGIKTLNIPPQKLKYTYGMIPDAVISNEGEDNLKAMMGRTSMNPLQHNFANAIFWPVYHIRLKLVEWDYARRNEMLEEVRALEFRLLHLKNSVDGQPNAKIEQEIEKTEAMISKLTKKIHDLEEG